ncbi:putative membrane protein SirB2 [Silvimonas terrae]|uniref:Putative membrane protein SirB2 n=1 Tax=Silvimonas terrae TaxID=300266 RepID=A0A840RL07_9NEIS|nr:SirB2 family protein [Silvimonas terrae]MBB5193150.1 putative membrane protein SirB2 [Silvimonas terrae]
MAYYLIIKQIHVTCVLLSGLLFLYRGGLMLAASPRLRQTWLRVLPHIVDTVLLTAGVTLAVISHQYPGQQPWLTAKLIGLVVYIGLGMIALKRGKTRKTRAIAFVAALLVFAWIIGVAVTRTPLSFFALLPA